jgi:hypothetical protein
VGRQPVKNTIPKTRVNRAPFTGSRLLKQVIEYLRWNGAGGNRQDRAKENAVGR